MTASFIAFSFSRLNQYEECPRKFYEVQLKKNIKEKESEAMLEGKAQHKALELRVKINKPLPPAMQQHEPMVKKLIASPAVKQTELQLAITPQFKKCEWFDPRGGPPTVWCRAVVDLGLKMPDRAVIIDYKTGKISSDFTQMRLTGAVYMHNFPEVQKVTLMYAWLKFGDSSKITMDRSEIPDTWNLLMPRINRFQEAHRKQEYPPRPDRHCKWCPVNTCPHWEGG